MYRARCAVLAIAAALTTAVATAAPALAQPSHATRLHRSGVVAANATPPPVDAPQGGAETITVVVPPVATSTPTMPPPPPSIAPPGVGGDRERWGRLPVTGDPIALLIASALTLIACGVVLRIVLRRRRSVDSRP